MVEQSPHDFASLGSALTRARDEGVLEPDQFGHLAGALAAAVLSGTMRMSDYAAVHGALSMILDAVFNDPTLFASVPSSGEGAGLFDSKLEVIGEMWGSVDDTDSACELIHDFVENSFDLKRADFGDNIWFFAPLYVDFDGLKKGLRKAGLSILRIEGEFNEKGRYVAIGGGDCCFGEGRMILSCGERIVG
ncbi:hypothetical protein FDZ71_01555, partial [bacterium]